MVVPDREAVRQVGDRVVVQRHAGRDPLDPELEVVVERLRDDPGITVREVVALLAHRLELDAGEVVAGRRELQPLVRDLRVPLDLQIRERRHREVRLEVVLLLLVVGHHAGVVLIPTGQVVLQRLPAAPHRQVVVLVPLLPGEAAVAARGRVVVTPEVVPRRLVEGRRRVVGLVGRDAVPPVLATVVPTAPPGATHEVLHVQVVHAVDPVLLEPAGALLDVDRPDRRPLRAALREDLDHARRSLGAVQRRRGRALDDLDALDVVRVDVVERAHRDLSAPPLHHAGGAHAREGSVHHPHAVDVDDRLVRHRDAGVSAQADLASLAELAAAARHLDPGRRALEQVADQHGPLRDVGDVELRDRVSDLASPRGARRPGHDDLVEPERLRGQREVGNRGATGGDRHRLLLRLVADPLDAKLVSAHGHVEDQVPAVRPGQASELEPDDVDLHLRDRTPRLGVGDRPGDLARLRARGRREQAESQRHRERDGGPGRGRAQ